MSYPSDVNAFCLPTSCVSASSSPTRVLLDRPLVLWPFIFTVVQPSQRSNSPAHALFHVFARRSQDMCILYKTQSERAAQVKVPYIAIWSTFRSPLPIGVPSLTSQLLPESLFDPSGDGPTNEHALGQIYGRNDRQMEFRRIELFQASYGSYLIWVRIP